MYFLFHCIYPTAIVTSYIADLDFTYETWENSEEITD